ncbi:MAG: hypothetical protein WD060_14040 [Pirellulales bacterium]
MNTSSHRRVPPSRRGALLLLVLTSLTLFMMIGAVMLVVATRSRTAARAFSDATNSTASGSMQAWAMLDEALMVLLRGSKSALPAVMTESILDDKYGTDVITGTATPPARLTLGSLSNFTPILSSTLQGLTPAPTHPCDLNGRILTFKPTLNDGDVSSYRILRTTATGGAYTVYLANTPTARSPALPKQSAAVVINGREFTPSISSTAVEAYDSFDKDPWLAQIPLSNSRPITSGSIRPSYGTQIPAGSAACDNDNDGLVDGMWIPGTAGFLAERPSSLGGTLKYKASYLVLDLDSRLNLNTHGTLVPVTTNSADWPADVAGTAVGSVPLGLGYGPADVDASRIVASGSAVVGAPGFPGRWSSIVVAGTSASANGSSQRRPTPLVGLPINGRYGVDAGGKYVPGKPDSTVPPLQQWALGGGSPTDLNVRMKTFVTSTASGAPTLVFYTPDRNANDFLESPYELRLDGDGPRGTQVRQPSAKSNTPPSDSPFAATELERILRPFDSDAGTLPPRLAALLDDYAERSRMTITTDSWDTPVITGTAMTKVRDYLRQFPAPSAPSAAIATGSAAVYDTMSPDVSAGVRFDINRPLQYANLPPAMLPKIKEKYCQHLYTLLVALGQPANQQTAQWAANVCDFRDADSTMTRFRFDTTPSDGWTAGTSSVFGAERPEVVITETLAWSGYLSVVLYHPWAAWMVDKATATNMTAGKPAEVVDPNLADTGNPNALDLSRKNAAGESIWRLRVAGGSQVAFGDVAAALGAAEIAKCKLLPNGYLCVQTSAAAGTALPSLTVSAFTPGAPGAGTVMLERLADPTKPKNDDQNSDDYNPYVAVDQATLIVYPDKDTAQKQQRNPGTFWKQAWSPVAGAPAAYPSKAPWFHWPNRPFVSIAELALVPNGDASSMLAVGAAASPVNAPTNLILDAVHVPSRFGGTSMRIGDDSLLLTTATTERVCTTLLPKWREPGRVNVNTIVANPGNTTSQLDNAAWKALVGDGVANVNGGTNPFATGMAADVANSVTKLLSMSSAPDNPIFTDSPLAPRNDDPFFTYATANRMANCGTIRSHVFAVWITLEITDDSASAPTTTYKRMFAIVDRSIPVGFSKGEDLNVRDTIRLVRYLE